LQKGNLVFSGINHFLLLTQIGIGGVPLDQWLTNALIQNKSPAGRRG
jgi:hypothetical protein